MGFVCLFRVLWWGYGDGRWWEGVWIKFGFGVLVLFKVWLWLLVFVFFFEFFWNVILFFEDMLILVGFGGGRKIGVVGCEREREKMLKWMVWWGCGR